MATSENRTWRLEMFTPKNSDYKIVIHREELIKFDDREIQAATSSITKNLSNVFNEDFIIDGNVFTIGQLASAISDKANEWATNIEPLSGS